MEIRAQTMESATSWKQEDLRKFFLELGFGKT
jgi:hypothetical protein